MPAVNIMMNLSTQIKRKERDVFDIYDCSSVDFFEDKNMISH
jgi:hypothetical protein